LERSAPRGGRRRVRLVIVSDDALLEAWNAIHKANESLGWYIGPPAFEERLAVPWSLYAFDPREKPKVGHRSREWTAIGPTQERVVREMARCLRETRQPDLPPPHE
jgi:hypothetical protein